MIFVFAEFPLSRSVMIWAMATQKINKSPPPSTPSRFSDESWEHSAFIWGMAGHLGKLKGWKLQISLQQNAGWRGGNPPNMILSQFGELL